MRPMIATVAALLLYAQAGAVVVPTSPLAAQQRNIEKYPWVILMVEDPTDPANVIRPLKAAADGSLVLGGPITISGGSVSVTGGTVTANQGTPNTAANGWPTKLTDGVNTAVVAANGAVAVGDTSGQQLGLESTLTTANSHLTNLDDRSGLLGNGLQVQGTRPQGQDFLEYPVVIGGRDDTSPNNAIRALHTSSVGDVYIRPAIGLATKVAYAEIDAAGETQLVAAQAGVKYRVTQTIVINEGYTLAAGTIHFTATQTNVGGGPSGSSNVIVPFAASNNAGVASPTQISGAVSGTNQPIYVNMESLTGGGTKVRIAVHYIEE